MGTILERLSHKLTAYHWRKGNLLICSCGWEPWWFRKVDWTSRLRRMGRRFR